MGGGGRGVSTSMVNSPPPFGGFLAGASSPCPYRTTCKRQDGYCIMLGVLHLCKNPCHRVFKPQSLRDMPDATAVRDWRGTTTSCAAASMRASKAHKGASSVYLTFDFL